MKNLIQVNLAISMTVGALFGCKTQTAPVSSRADVVSPTPVTIQDPAPPPTFKVYPGARVIHSNLSSSSIRYSALANQGPVTYSVSSGPGSIGSANGDYFMDPSFVGRSTIRGLDSARPTHPFEATLYQVASRFNAPVRAIAVSNGYGYFGGEFTVYSPYILNGFGKVDATTGDLSEDCNFAGLLNPKASVLAIAETATAIFVGGRLSSYAGQPVQNLIKLDKASCTVDTNFTLSTGFDGPVLSLSVSGGSLFVGGSFTSYRGIATNYLAKLHLNSGNLDPSFNQSVGPNNSVKALIVSGNALYVGGQFTTYRGKPAPYLAKVDLTSGNLDTKFTQSSGLNNFVSAFALTGGSLYVGGAFTTYRKVAANYLAKLDANSGVLDTTFTQSSGLNHFVSALAISENSLYLGGSFTTYREIAANYVGKVDLNLGVLDTTFTQKTGADQPVTTLGALGKSLYLGGQFTTYRGAPARRLAKVDLRTGDLDPVFTQLTGFNDEVSSLISSGDSLYLGGPFNIYRGTPANFLAKVDLRTGQLDTQFTQTTGPDNKVWSLAISGNALYIGGQFLAYRNRAINFLAKVDLISGNADTSFNDGNQGPDGRWDLNWVTSMVVSGNSLYIIGYFTQYRWKPAMRLAKIDLSSGELDTTFTQAQGLAGDSVNWAVWFYSGLAVSGNSLYVGGTFTRYREHVVSNLIKVDLITGDLDTTFTQSTGFGPVGTGVLALAVSGESLYVAGNFKTYREKPAVGLAKIHLFSGDLDTTFTQSSGVAIDSVTGNSFVASLVVSGNSLYLGGFFSSYRETAVHHLAKVNLTSGDLDSSFNQNIQLNEKVWTLAVFGGSLYAGGAFTTSGDTAPENAATHAISVDLFTGNRTSF